ncbi:hypothetical protein [Pseudoalteromonas sp. BDTF-M6]|uniref:hypothetical protein n=1 Tax=Pseudoalteromonas sp. BDTF-M6 TaxID=2796132 RepID=UPI001BAFFA56|nr:hypothetical protein [Pseudoalteromonas sp. BDTF-M6]MBS3798764.1 hypothetical protein [Pseudoalteromonas sp. BDTF-M6]
MKTNVKFWWGTSWFSCVTITMKNLFTLFLVIGLALSTQNAFADDPDPGPASDNGVQPVYFPDNPTCADLMSDIPGLLEYRINEVGDGTFEAGDGASVDIETFSNKTFDWESSGMVVHSIFVKGGPGGNLYEYNPESGSITTADGNLHAPENPKNGNYYGLSHISFCYTPGVPEITITKTCTGGGFNEAGTALIYNYELTVANTGTLPLFDIKAIDTTAEDLNDEDELHTYTKDGLLPGETETFPGSFEINVNSPTNEAEVTAAIVDGGEVAVEDMTSFICPPQETAGKLSLTKDCDVLVVLNDYGDYGLQVNYSGEVCNKSEVAITGVVVQDNKDSDAEFIGDLPPMGHPDSCKPYSGSYVPVPGEGELGDGTPGFEVGAFTDIVTASGSTALGDDVTADPADASCTLCPQCVDMEMCPTPASAIDLE